MTSEKMRGKAMAKAIVEIDQEDEISEELKPEYEKRKVRGKDGKEREIWVLKIEGIEVHPSIQPLQNTLTKLKRQIEEVRTAARASDFDTLLTTLKALPDDFDVEALTTMKARLEELETQLAAHNDDEADPEAKKKRQQQQDQWASARTALEQKIVNIQKKAVDDLAAKDRIIAERDTEIVDLVRGERLRKAVVDGGVQGPFVDAVIAMHERRVNVKKNDTGKYDALVDTDLGEVPVEKFMGDWLGGDVGKQFVTKPKGSDGKGSDERKIEGNIFEVKDGKWDQLNLTEISRAVKADPIGSERKMKAAKWPQEKIDKYLNKAAA